MLSYLKIQNLAIIESSEIEFSHGLNVITGETGAGKSIILKAIGLLCGARASTELIRQGEEGCSIEGIFNLNQKTLKRLREASEELESLLQEDEIIIRRQIDKSGKGKIFVNGSIVSLNSLQLLTSFLVEVTGQHQHQSLTNISHQRSLLDQFGVSGEALKKVNLCYHSFIQAKKAFNDLEERIAKKGESLTSLKEQTKELQKAGLELGEKQKVQEKVSKFAHFETLSSKISSCIELLSSEEGLGELLKKSSYLIEETCKIDSSLKPSLEMLESASVQVDETLYGLEKYINNLQIDPESLEIARERLAEICHLERKYKKSAVELIDLKKVFENQIKELEESDWSLQKLEKAKVDSEKELKAAETILTAERQRAATKLSKQVEKELETLGMSGAKFKIEVSPQESSSVGADNINFLLAANKGEGFRPLSKAASGGELSRVLLILKIVAGGDDACLTQIFDEIDTGIGGSVAGLVAERLKTISKSSQVILITHSAQIASFADVHLLVEKEETKNRTTSKINILDNDKRVESLAIMLAGQKESKNIKETAKELLSNSKR